MEKPIAAVVPDNAPAEPRSNYKFKSIPKRMIIQAPELVYDPVTQYHGGEPIFIGDFECGNLGRVLKISPKHFEIHLLPDPTKYYSALWFFFRVQDMPAGDYTFTIIGFFRDEQLHNQGVQPTALFDSAKRHNIGWQRIGRNMNYWLWGKQPHQEYAFQFSFTLSHKDSAYFSYLYPYTYTDLKNYLSRIPNKFTPSSLTKTIGGIEVPALFWNPEEKSCQQISSLFHIKPSVYSKKDPVIVICARHHPGEPNSSYAMEGFMDFLFSGNSNATQLLAKFSFLIIPMMNPDGVICGYYRPMLNGYDQNRIWNGPNRREHPEAWTIIRILDELSKTRKIIFFLDFHGHTAQNNAFCYGVNNESVRFNNLQTTFQEIMSDICPFFDIYNGTNFPPNQFSTTMRTALHLRYKIPFSYTLELSFGGCNLMYNNASQMSPNSYRKIGECVGNALSSMMNEIPVDQIVQEFLPPLRTKKISKMNFSSHRSLPPIYKFV